MAGWHHQFNGHESEQTLGDSEGLQSPSTVILKPKKIKSVTLSTFSPFICHEMMGLDALILVFLNVKL